MRYVTPWSNRLFVETIAVTRRGLRPFCGLEERFIDALVQGHNRLVHRHLRRNGIGTVLLIMPRCMKQTDCRCDVRSSLAECRTCDRCQLGDLARLCNRYGLRALVAFRSHIAFEIARREQPDLIIATACHDRLIKALRSVPEIPALLAPLTAMQRPCINATCDLEWFELQLQRVGAEPTRLAHVGEGF